PQILPKTPKILTHVERRRAVAVLTVEIEARAEHPRRRTHVRARRRARRQRVGAQRVARVAEDPRTSMSEVPGCGDGEATRRRISHCDYRNDSWPAPRQQRRID